MFSSEMQHIRKMYICIWINRHRFKIKNKKQTIFKVLLGIERVARKSVRCLRVVDWALFLE